MNPNFEYKTADEIKYVFVRFNCDSYPFEVYKALEFFVKDMATDCERYNFIFQNRNSIEESSISIWNRNNKSNQVNNLCELKDKLTNYGYHILYINNKTIFYLDI